MKSKLKTINNKNETNNDIFELVSSYDTLVKKYGSENNILEYLKHDNMIPLNLFCSKSPCLEVVVKFMVDNLNLDCETISVILNRNIKNINKAYNKSSNKNYKHQLESNKSLAIVNHNEISNIMVPLVIFKHNSLSMLESLVKYIKDVHAMKYSQIATILNRDQRTIWTIYNRASKKI